MSTLNSSSVEEPPLPTVALRSVSDGSASGATKTPGTPSDAPTATVNAGMLLVMVFTALLI
nr:unknown [Zea mays]